MIWIGTPYGGSSLTHWKDKWKGRRSDPFCSTQGSWACGIGIGIAGKARTLRRFSAARCCAPHDTLQTGDLFRRNEVLLMLSWPLITPIRSFLARSGALTLEDHIAWALHPFLRPVIPPESFCLHETLPAITTSESPSVGGLHSQPISRFQDLGFVPSVRRFEEYTTTSFQCNN